MPIGSLAVAFMAAPFGEISWITVPLYYISEAFTILTNNDLLHFEASLYINIPARPFMRLSRFVHQYIPTSRRISRSPWSIAANIPSPSTVAPARDTGHLPRAISPKAHNRKPQKNTAPTTADSAQAMAVT